eukprot:1590395-Amphidinium_carterae.2
MDSFNDCSIDDCPSAEELALTHIHAPRLACSVASTSNLARVPRLAHPVPKRPHSASASAHHW